MEKPKDIILYKYQNEMGNLANDSFLLYISFTRVSVYAVEFLLYKK